MNVQQLTDVSGRRALVAVTTAVIAAAAVFYLYLPAHHPVHESVVPRDDPPASAGSGDLRSDSHPTHDASTAVANGDDREPAVPKAEVANAEAYPGESANHGARNLWGIVSDDGKTFQVRRASLALTGADSYRELMDGLAHAPDARQRQRMAETITNELAAIATDGSIYEMACGSRMCIGTLVLPSDDVARQLAQRLSDSREESGIYRVMIDLGNASSGLNRFLLVTDPAVRGTLLAVGPDFRPPARLSPQVIDALVKAVTQTHPPKQ